MTLSFSILNDYIYYVDSSDGNNKLWRMKLDGTGGKMLTEEKVSAFNVSGDWIYYGNTQFDTVGLELKKMKLDGSDKTVINDDDTMMINVHDDMLVYLCFDFTSFGFTQTIMKTDGTGRKDYAYAPTPQAQDITRYRMDEKVQAGPLTVIVTSAYSTNIMKNENPELSSVIYDDTTEGAFLFINMEVWNESGEDVDLYHRTGTILDVEEMGLTVYWNIIGVADGIREKDDIAFHLKRSQYGDHITVNAGEVREIQTFMDLPEPSFPVYLGLFDGDNADPLALIEVLPTAENYVISWNQASAIIESEFQGYEIKQLGGIGYRMADDPEETIYYGFELMKPGEGKVEHYFVKRDTGEIYIGASDTKFPDYPAVPIKPID